MLESISLAVIQVPPEMVRNWGWFVVFGVLLALLGIVAVARSLSATVVTMMFFGWLLLIAGGIEFVSAFMVGRWTGFFLHILAAILFAVTGLVVLIRPVIGAEIATLVMSMFFLIGGLYQIGASFVAGLPGSGWEVFGGVTASVMGVVLLLQWPLSGLWAIGLFIGIDLIVDGCAWIALALNLRRM